MAVHPKSQGGSSQRTQQGYVLLTLLLVIALLIIATAVIVPSITFEIRRDREEEMIHRGVQYSRAIRLYYKKFGRYPSKLEDLESANNLRFLRKRYKDPFTGKDFKLVHFGEVRLSLGGIGGGTIPGANPIGGTGTTTGGFLGGTSGGFGQTSTFGGNTSYGPSGNSPFGQNPSQQTTNTQTGTTPSTGPDASQPGTQNPSDTSGANPSAPGGSTENSGNNQLGSGQIIGGAIIGVASTSKDETIREFNHKKKYKDWVFVYDPAQDQGRLITTPYQPQMLSFGMQGIQNVNGPGTPGNAPGALGGFGTGNTFGSSPLGMQNPNQQPSQQNQGSGTPNQPNSPQQQ